MNKADEALSCPSARWLTAESRFILPILAEYSDAGYREPQGKLMYSLRSNAQYYAMVFGFGILALIYVLVSYGVHLDSLKSPVMALAYCWGLVLAIYLMGHGLVSIPRSLVRNASISGRLRRLQEQAPRAHEQMEEAETNLEELENQVAELCRRKTGTALDFQDWIEELSDLTNLPEAQPRPQSAIGAAATRRVPTVITEKYMAELTRELNRARHARSRYVSEWNRLLRDAARAQAILDCGPSKKLEFGRAAPHAPWWEKLTLLTPYTRYLLHFHVMPTVRLGFGGLLALASACIIWSEIVKAGPAPLVKLSIIRVSVVHHWAGDKGQVGFAGQVIAALWITYMCAAALISITEVKVWRGRALVWRNTAHESAFWYSSYVARLSVPLAYNFVTFLSRDVYEKTRFYDFLGRLIDLTSLGSWFNRLFPLFILLPVCATLFGLYGKVKRTIGLADIVDEDDNDQLGGYGSGSWLEGRNLIDRELNGTSIPRPAGAVGPGDRSAPIRSIPGAPNRIGSPTTPLGTSPHAGTIASASQPAGASRRIGQGQRNLDNEDEEDNFFAALGHRIKNTVDTIDTPKWLQEITKKPKWMDNDDNDSGQASGSGAPDFDIRRLFGGNNGGVNGQIRL